MSDKEIDLGFAEKCDKKILLSSIAYPSKLGGRPSWLRWDPLLNECQVRCENCSKVMQFLCQIYIPIEINEERYHKSVYLFCCPNGNCYATNKKCIRAFTSILKEDSGDITEEELETKTDNELMILLNAKESLQKMCNVCSLSGNKQCSKCHSVNYCSKDHQLYDWKVNKHKDLCGRANEIHSVENKFKFDEYEIVIEEEPSKDETEEVNKYNIDESKMKELLNDTQPLDKNLQKEFEKATASTVDDYFDKFKRRIKREPEQIIRYSLGGTPLWVSSENIPSKKEILNCHCGSERQFEFQVLPQMLSYLGIETTVDSIDWGTLCIYTCTQNCQLESYREDFVWRQDFSQTNI